MNKIQKTFSIIGFLILFFSFLVNFSFAITIQDQINKRLDTVSDQTQTTLDAVGRESQLLSTKMRIENIIEIQKALITTGVKTRFRELENVITTRELEQHIGTKRQETDLQMQKSRSQFEQDLKSNELNTAVALQQKDEDTLKFLKERQEIFDMDTGFRKEEMEAKIEESQKELEKKLANIKDANKRSTVEELADDFQSVNRKAMDKFAKDVNNLDIILAKAESSADKVMASGQSVANLRSLVDSAEITITDARNAVALQYGKVYIIPVKDEASLKQVTKATRDSLQADINKVNEKVQIAVNSVNHVSDMLAKVLNILDTDHASINSDIKKGN